MFDPTFIDNPYPTYARLRAAGPVHRNQDFAGGAWLLPRYVDVMAAFRDPRLSSRRSHAFIAQFAPEQRAELAEFDRAFARWMLFLDPPEHGALRRFLNKGFKPSMLQALRPRIERLAHELLDRVGHAGRMDFMRDFAHPFPALVIAEMLGVDHADQHQFIAWSDDIAAFMGNPRATFETARAAQASLVALTEYFRAVLPKRRASRGEDLISLLIEIEEQEELIDTEELLAQCSLILFAGHETTRNLLGNGLYALLMCPEQWDRLKRDRSLMTSAIKELLRYDSPLQHISRVAREDFTLHGHEIETGQRLVLMIGAANRDPDQFPAADELDITRKQGAHLAFGFGAHVCIGAALSYLEADIAFNALMDRMPDCRLEGPPVRSRNMAFRGFAALPLSFGR